MEALGLDKKDELGLRDFPIERDEEILQPHDLRITLCAISV